MVNDSDTTSFSGDINPFPTPRLNCPGPGYALASEMGDSYEDVKPAEDVDWVQLVAFLRDFEDPDFDFGQMRSPDEREAGVFVFPMAVLSSRANDFVMRAYRVGAIAPFDWGTWVRAEGRAYIDDPESVERADFDDIRKLLTAHVRQDRFVEGHLLHAFDAGRINAILRRLKELTA